MTFEAIVEIPKGSNQKFEINEQTGEFEVNFVFKHLVYPFNYGFVPNTLAPDGDPVDVNLISDRPLKTGDRVTFRPIGLMKMKDRGKQDNKIFGVLESDEANRDLVEVEDISDLWSEYVDLYQEIARQKKKITIFEGWGTKDEAIAEIKNSLSVS